MNLSRKLLLMLEDFESEKEQKISSAKTSVNTLPRTFKIIHFDNNTINLDYGGGRFETATNFLKTMGVKNLVYDPYNRSSSHNRDVLDEIKEEGGADTATCNNVLNVIAEKESRMRVIKNIHHLLKDDGKAYFCIYKGDGSQIPKETKSGFQNNIPTKAYVPEIQEVFSKVSITKDIIIAEK